MISRKQTDHHLKNGRFQHPWQFCGYREIDFQARHQRVDRQARAHYNYAMKHLRRMAEKQIAKVAEQESA